MANTWHGRILVTELPPGWTNEDRTIAAAALKGIGTQSAVQPCHVTHSRISTNGREIELESLWSEGEITREAVVAVIAEALNVNPTAVNAKIEYEVLGGEGATLAESNAAMRTHMAADPANWDAPA